MNRKELNTIKTLFISVLLTALAAVSVAVSFAADETTVPVCRSSDEAAVSLRNAMKERSGSVDICLVTDTAASDSEGIISDIFDHALEHTGDPCEGDYLRFQYGSCDASARPVSVSGENAVLITYTLEYYDTAEQESQIDEKVAEIISSLELDDMSDTEKVSAIYDYILENVEYDYENLSDDYVLKRTAYAALVDGKAVCQGYSAALYRLLLEAGIDNRIIYGTGITDSGENVDHTWNIVKIDGSYYNTDVTKDDELGDDDGFLKGSGEFDEKHIRSEEYTAEDFTSEFAVSESDYGKDSGGILEHIGAFSLSIKMLFQKLLDMC